jgi:hypothetical protein
MDITQQTLGKDCRIYSNLNFVSLHNSSGGTGTSTILTVPANETYTLEKIFLQNDGIAGMLSVESGGLIYSHIMPSTADGLLQSDNLNIPITGTIDLVRAGLTNNSHSFVTLQYMTDYPSYPSSEICYSSVNSFALIFGVGIALIVVATYLSKLFK